jgi:hypothetical protein
MKTIQTFRLTNGYIEHVIEVAVESIGDGIQVVSRYLRGSLDLEPHAMIAKWPAQYECPNDFDPGHVAIGDGRIKIEIPELRRLGLGSLFMGCLVHWIKTKPSVPVETILLKIDDARTTEAKESRNRFYEKFGFTFNYEDDRTWGSSRPIHSAELLDPAPTVPDGWTLQEL